MPLMTFRRVLTATRRTSNLLSHQSLPLSSRHIGLKPKLPFTLLLLYHRSLSSLPTQNPATLKPPQKPQDPITPTPTRSRTPLEKQFETWVQNLKPGFSPIEVDEALRAQSDPDLALDIFRWTAQQRNYKHNHLTYLTMIGILIDGKRYGHAETLVEEVIAGACEISVPLYNSMIRFCCDRKFLFNRAFDVYKKMLKSEDCKPTLETYTLLFNSLLRRFNKLNVSYVYLRAVRSLTKQMKACGVIPDTFVLNMIIKAYSKCLEVDEAIRVFHEMGLYGCEPNAYTYGYIAKGLCEKGRVGQGLKFYKEMRKKDLVPSGSTYMIVICSLAMERKFEEAIEVVFDMLGNSLSPDLLTYRTLLEGLCKDERGDEAFTLLDEFRKRDGLMGEKNYKILLNGLHFVNRE
ncbi:pentatricopeptide repeat-containing protein At3g25210, mitochondrial [Ziziphus jujuba]|uniref:Pentatricopeptide repeat-containing protein At3g25210, mitochondrial n=1 Tax=Ziziphus jujuba TaxID=326968 RepID=A0ABM3IVZ7_ZIZJJ|nr:pentatricopeptide repeat-containing protein At3g25210, mitochondrial [Ziziphus jujuba]